MASTDKYYTLGKGKVYFDPFLLGTNTKTGERYIGNTPEFSYTIESTNLDHFDSDAGIRTKDESVTTEINRTGTITTDNIDPYNVSLFLLAASGTQTQTSQTGVSETIASPLKDRYYQLGVSASNPSGVRAITTVTVTQGTLKTEGTDYVLDLALGRVFFPATSSITEGTAITIGYNRSAATRQQIITSANAALYGGLRFVATNPKGVLLDYYMPKVKLAPSGDYALKGDDWQSMQFSLEILELDSVTAAIYVDGRAVTA